VGAHRPGGRAAPGVLTDAPRHRTVYGRRRGRKLRAGQRARRDALLPQLRIELPDDDGPVDPRALFAGPVAAVWLEIGFGAGEHLAWQAAQNPSVGLIGCEVFENGVARLLRAVGEQGLGNVRVFTDDARLLLARLAGASIERAFILFPDPWPKQRHHKRRMVATRTLDLLAAAMIPGAELRLATDDVDYLRWMLARAPVHPAFEWLARGPADWRERPPDWPQTRYEAKAIEAGRTPFFLRLRRRPRA
jgi:tRNA (guanine-N7-)-methyltransferase